jgi:hypothetical protein
VVKTLPDDFPMGDNDRTDRWIWARQTHAALCLIERDMHPASVGFV